MEINRKYKEGFLAALDKSQRGEVMFLPNALDRVNKIFNLMQSRYCVIAGPTGSGKTSLADFLYVLNPWTYLNVNDIDIHWEVNYFSLERKVLFKHAKWVSWMIYRDYPNILVSADQILGYDGGPLNDEGYKLVRSYDEEMSNLLEHTTIRDGKVGAATIKKIIKRRALALGDYFHSDETGVFLNDHMVYIERFDDKKLVEKTKIGEIAYINVEFKGMKFRMYQDDHFYIPHNPKTFVFFIVDGINLLGSKDEIDAISAELSHARDVFGFSPVVITQQNRAMGDVQRAKLHGNDLAPQIEDAFKSSQMGFDADLFLGVHDPYRYKSWDKEGKYGGYVIQPAGLGSTVLSMQTPGGINRFRSLHVLKNTFGSDGHKFGMKFLGECNHFEVLPRPEDVLELENVYSQIRRGL